MTDEQKLALIKNHVERGLVLHPSEGLFLVRILEAAREGHRPPLDWIAALDDWQDAQNERALDELIRRQRREIDY